MQMAEFEIKCPHCQAKLAAEDEWIGLKVECPICSKSLIVEKADAPNDTPTETEIQKHLQYASIALKSGAVQEAKKEFEIVLAKKPDDPKTLYFVMLCDVYMSTPENPSLDNVVYRYKKIEHIIQSGQDNSWSCEELKKRFISEVGPFIVNTFGDIFSSLIKLKDDIKLRESLNTLTAFNSGLFLSNPEAIEAENAKNRYLPCLVQLNVIRKFIISLIDMDAIGEDFEMLTLIKKIFESTFDISKYEPELIPDYNRICKMYEIGTIINTRQCSYQDAEVEYERRHALPPGRAKLNAIAAKKSSPVWLVLAILSSIGVPTVVFLIFFLLAKADIFLGAIGMSLGLLLPSFGGLFLGIFLFCLFFTALGLEKQAGKRPAFYKHLNTGWCFFKRIWWILVFWAAVILGFVLDDKPLRHLGIIFGFAAIATGVIYFVVWFYRILLHLIISDIKK